MDRVWGFNEGRPQHSRPARILIELNLNNVIAVSFIDVSDEWRFISRRVILEQQRRFFRIFRANYCSFPRWCLKIGLALGRWSAAVPWKKVSVDVNLYPLTVALEPRHRFLQGATARVDQAGAKRKRSTPKHHLKLKIWFGIQGTEAPLNLWKFRQLGVKEPVPDLNPPIVQAGVEAWADIPHVALIVCLLHLENRPSFEKLVRSATGQIRNPQRAERRRSLG